MSTSWTGAGAAVVATGFGGAVPIPLLLLFRDELALSDAAVTLAFAITAAGIVAGLLLAARCRTGSGAARSRLRPPRSVSRHRWS